MGRFGNRSATCNPAFVSWAPLSLGSATNTSGGRENGLDGPPRPPLWFSPLSGGRGLLFLDLPTEADIPAVALPNLGAGVGSVMRPLRLATSLEQVIRDHCRRQTFAEETARVEKKGRQFTLETGSDIRMSVMVRMLLQYCAKRGRYAHVLLNESAQTAPPHEESRTLCLKDEPQTQRAGTARP